MNTWYLQIEFFDSDEIVYAITKCKKYDTASARAMKWCEQNSYNWSDINATLKPYDNVTEYITIK
jgi:hypothetical protein